MSESEAQTTNFPKDSHYDFCERCMAFNKGCPNTGTKHKDKNCNL